MSLEPTFAPSNLNCTPDTPAAAEAEAVTVILPETVEPAVGVAMETVGEAGAFATPVPDKLNGASAPEASLVMEMLEFAAPAVVGAKCTWIVADCPAAIVAPVDSPLAVKPLAGALTAEMCTVA